jgi:hypothetical protein
MRRIRAPLYRRVVGRVISPVGMLLTAVGLVGVPVSMAAVFFFYIAVKESDASPLLLGISLLSLAVSYAMLKGGSHLRIAGQRLRQPTGAMVLATGVPFILLLRSFVTDSARHPDQSLMSRAVRGIKLLARFADAVVGPPLEAPLVTALAEFHPVVAVGRPGEWLPTLGASRLYLGPDEWQQEVERLIVDATFIVLIAGGTQGLLWELQTTLHAGALPKVLIYVPIDFAAPEPDNARWQEFRTVLLKTVPVHESELPTEFPTDVVIRWVAVDGQLRVRVVRPTYDAAVTDLRGSLRDVGQEFALKQRQLEIRTMIGSLLRSEAPASSVH